MIAPHMRLEEWACITYPLRAGSLEDTIALARKALANDGIATAWKLSQNAISQAPESAVAHEFGGEVLFRRGDFAQAQGEFSRASKLGTNFEVVLGLWLVRSTHEGHLLQTCRFSAILNDTLFTE